MKIPIIINEKMLKPKCLIYLVGYDREYIEKDSPSKCKDCEEKIRCHLQ